MSKDKQQKAEYNSYKTNVNNSNVVPEWDEGWPGAGAWGRLGIEGVTEGVDVREFVEVAGVVSAATVAALGEAATDKADVDVVVEADDFVASRSRICFSTWNDEQ